MFFLRMNILFLNKDIQINTPIRKKNLKINYFFPKKAPWLRAPNIYSINIT